MATPASGAISLGDMRTEITRGAGAISMSEIRTRYGGTDAISFNSLYACEGWIQTNGIFTSKYVTYDGWLSPSTGSVAPNDGSQTVVVTATAPGSKLYSFYNLGGSDSWLGIGNTSSSSGLPTAGYRGTDVIRVVTANTNRTIGGTAATNNTVYVTYVVAGSGTIHNLVQF
tara:strand:+ start:3984 stop:4496 length:513 start_codon:yes stop_codon:yes gene_type:complete